jgi:hypothetical protein
MPCTNCTHPSCPHSLLQLGVCSCVECDAGTLVLDQRSAPKWYVPWPSSSHSTELHDQRNGVRRLTPWSLPSATIAGGWCATNAR